MPVAMAFALVASADAVVIVNIDSTPTGTGTFLYSVFITNDTVNDLAVVSLIDGPTFDSFIAPSLMSPSGFSTSYDSGLGFVDFIEDSSAFTSGGTFGAFTFESMAAPGTAFTMFEALDVMGDSVSGMTTVVPEPGTFTLAALAILPPIIRRRRLA